MRLLNSATCRAGTRKETVFAIFLAVFAVYLVFHVVKLTRSLATKPAPGQPAAAVVEEPSGMGAATSATNPVRVTSPLPSVSPAPMPVTMPTTPPPGTSPSGGLATTGNNAEAAGDAGGSVGPPPVLHLGSTRTFTIVYPSVDYFDSNAVTIVLVPIDDDPTNAPPVAVPQSRSRRK